MYILAILAVVSAVTTGFITPLFRNWLRLQGIVDHPDRCRKIHQEPIPRGGGVIIALACSASFLLLQLIGPQTGHLGLVWRLMPASFVILFTGLLDDVRGLTAWQKLFGQLTAAGLVCWAGLYLHSFANIAIPVWLGVPITIIWLVVCTNAFNLIDGVDGLAAGLGLIAGLVMLLSALLSDNLALAIAIVPLVGALAGFLRHNFHPATIFLGDSGSLLIGFALGCYGLSASNSSVTLLGMLAPLIALSIPLVDTILAIARRTRAKRSILSADRGHIHHRLLDRGFSPRKVAVTLYAVGALLAAISLCVTWAPALGLALAVFGAMVWVKETVVLRLLNSQSRFRGFGPRVSTVFTAVVRSRV